MVKRVRRHRPIRQTEARQKTGSAKVGPAVKLAEASAAILTGGVFVFFLLTGLVFVSGFLEGRIFCTLYDPPKAYFITAAVPFLAASYLFYLYCHPQERSAAARFLRFNFGLRLLGLWLLWLGGGCFLASVPILALSSLLSFVLLVLLAVVLSLLLQTSRWRWWALYGLLAGLAGFTIIGLLQTAGLQIPFLMPILGPASTFGYRNPAAHFITLVIPFLVFALWCFLRARRLLLATVSSVLGVGALFLLLANYSRVGIMVLGLEVVGLPFFWFGFYRSDSHTLGGRRPLVRVLLAAFLLLFLIVAAVMVFPDSRARVCRSYENFRRGGIASLLEARYYHWGNTLMMIRDHPLSGIGPGNFRVVYPLYAASFARDPLCNYQVQIYKAHNDYLQLAAECGIPALLFFLLLLGRQFYLLRYPDEGEDGEEDGGGRRWNPDWRLPLAASLLAYSVIMFFSFPLQMAYSRMFFFFLIALGEARAWPALLKR